MYEPIGPVGSVPDYVPDRPTVPERQSAETHGNGGRTPVTPGTPKKPAGTPSAPTPSAPSPFGGSAEPPVKMENLPLRDDDIDLRSECDIIASKMKKKDLAKKLKKKKKKRVQKRSETTVTSEEEERKKKYKKRRTMRKTKEKKKDRAGHGTLWAILFIFFLLVFLICLGMTIFVAGHRWFGFNIISEIAY